MALTSFKGTAYENWLTPAQAIQLLDPSGKASLSWRLAILERLRGGKIQAIAESVQFSGTRAPVGAKANQGPSSISQDTWDYVDHSNAVWHSGDLTINKAFGAFDSLMTRFFSVRFNPDDVKALIPTPLKAEIENPARSAEVEDQEKKPVSEAHLKLWAQLYQKTYGGTKIDTLDFAQRSAAGMFPDKAVGRDRVRALVGGNRKRGPKGEPAE